MFDYVNYYGVGKYISFVRDCEFYFIPYEYKSGTYKLSEIDYLKYKCGDFKELDEDKKREILKKYMLWIKYSSFISNDFSQISVSNMEVLDITYKSNENKKKGMLWEIVNGDNKDDFYRYVEKNSKDFEKVVDECVDIVYEQLFNKLKTDYKNTDICKLFLDFFNSFEAPTINFTVVCKKDIDKVLEKYGYYSYEEYFNKKYKGLKLFKRFVSYKSDYEKYINGILNYSGEYDFDECVYQLNGGNIGRVISYFCSFFEYDNMCGEFLYIVCNKVKEKLIDNLGQFKLADDFKFYDVSEWD